MVSPRVLCLGEILFDRLADQPGVPYEQVQSWTAYPGGAPANVACALTKLGTSAGFIGCVGSDTPGDELVQLLETLGVDTTGIQRHPSAPTRQVDVVRSTSGDRSFAGFGNIPPDQFADAFLQAKLLPESLFVQADFLVLGTLELAYPQTREAIYKALKLAEIYDVKVLLDVNWRPMFWSDLASALELIPSLFKSIDFLKVSEEEAELLFQTTDAGAIKYRLNSVEGVLVTAGEKEITYCLGETEGKASTFSVPVQDTTGAGDAFIAGFIHQLCQQGIQGFNDSKKVQGILRYACAVGALTTMKPGAIAAQPTTEEIEAFLQHQSPQ